MVKYIPKQGDIVYMDFNPTKGHEQKGKRPAIIISNDVFNINTKMAILCPITSNTKEFPTHYELEDSKKIKGSVLCEHIRSIDFNARKLSLVEKINEDELYEVIDMINGIIEIYYCFKLTFR